MIQKLLLSISLIFLSYVAFAQNNITIKGKISDSKDNSPMPSVSVVVKNTTIGTVTDLDGNFSLNIPSTDSTLIINFLGYKIQEFKIGNRATFDVNLEEDSKQLEEVMVTAVAIRKEKRELGYAVQEVKSQEILDSKETNLVNALNSKVAGVQITSSSGSPGAAARIRLRVVHPLPKITTRFLWLMVFR